MIEYLGGIAVVGALVVSSGWWWIKYDKKKEAEEIARVEADLKNADLKKMKRSSAAKTAALKKKVKPPKMQDDATAEPAMSPMNINITGYGNGVDSNLGRREM